MFKFNDRIIDLSVAPEGNYLIASFPDGAMVLMRDLLHKKIRSNPKLENIDPYLKGRLTISPTQEYLAYSIIDKKEIRIIDIKSNTIMASKSVQGGIVNSMLFNKRQDILYFSSGKNLYSWKYK